jgi:hypothetical protein
VKTEINTWLLAMKTWRGVEYAANASAHSPRMTLSTDQTKAEGMGRCARRSNYIHSWHKNSFTSTLHTIQPGESKLSKWYIYTRVYADGMVVLDNVHVEDQIIVRNVVAAIESLKVEKILLSWAVETNQGYYVVNAFIKDTEDCEFSKAELDTIHDVNPLRVISAAVARTGGKMRIKVRISDRNEPLMLTETQVLVVRKKARWAN